MNLKVANLVAVQFGVFVGIVSWLAYSRFESAEPRIAAVEIQKRPMNSVAAVAPISDLGSQVSRALDDGTDGEQDQSIGEQPAQATQPHHYSPEAVQQYMALAAQQYYQQIAPRRYASSGLENGSSVAVTPSYPEVAQEPEVAPPDYPAPQTVAYVQPAQTVLYPEPVQFVVFSNARSFARRCRPAAPFAGAHMPAAHRRAERAECHPHGHAMVLRQDAAMKSCRPTRELMAQGKR